MRSQAVLDSGIVSLMLELLVRGDFKTRKEAGWAVSNIILGGSEAQLLYANELHRI